MKTKNIKVINKVLGLVSTNCYFAVNITTNQVIIIDPADSPEVIKNVIAMNGYKPEAILLTHGHFDHILAAEAIKSEYNIPVYAGSAEKRLLEDAESNLSDSYGIGVAISADIYAEDDAILDIAGFTIKVLHTPGHTVGSVCYYFVADDVLFSGDTLFCESVGRTDFPTGSGATLVKSIKEKLLILPENTVVYPGHGESTSVGYEKQYNPYCN